MQAVIWGSPRPNARNSAVNRPRTIARFDHDVMAIARRTRDLDRLGGNGLTVELTEVEVPVAQVIQLDQIGGVAVRHVGQLGEGAIDAHIVLVELLA